MTLLSVGAAFAYWETTDSSNPAQAAAATLSAPTGGAVSGTTTSSAVSISWTAPSGYTPTGYTVERCTGSSCTPAPITSGGCGGALTTTSCTDNDPGLAAGTTYTYVVTASLDDWTSPAGTPFQASTTGATQLSFTAQPAANAQVQAGSTFPVSVAIQDGNGATVSNDSTDTVTLSLKNAGGAKLTCTNPGGLTVTASSGVANFTSCAINKVGKNYKLLATASTSSPLTVLGNSFDVVAGAATQLVFTTSAQNGPVSSTANLPVTVQEQDAAGNPVNAGKNGVTLSLSANPLAGAEFADTSGSQITSVTIPEGASSASFYVGDSSSGPLALTASGNGLTSATQTETIEALHLSITSNQTGGLASSTANIGPISVKLLMSDGTAVTTATTLTLSSSSTGTNEFSLTSGGPAISTITIPAGSSKATFYYGDELVGKPTITVSAPGNASDNQKVTVAPAGLIFSNVTVGSTTGKGKNSISSTLPSAVTCTGPVASLTCTINPEVPGGTSRFLTGQIALADQSGNATTSSSPVTITLTQTGGSSVTSSVTIPSGSPSSATFTENLPDSTTTNGVTSSPQGTVTATVTGVSPTASLTS